MSEELEEPDYEVTATHSGFEVRRYSDTIQARVRTEGTNWRGSSGGFRRIAGYIFGRNEREQMIAMTAPVHMWNDGEGKRDYDGIYDAFGVHHGRTAQSKR